MRASLVFVTKLNNCREKCNRAVGWTKRLHFAIKFPLPTGEEELYTCYPSPAGEDRTLDEFTSQ